MSSSSREASTTMRKLHHDMRTPLGQIIGYSEMLEEDARDAGRLDMVPDLENIQQAARELLGLVESVFQGEGDTRAGADEDREARKASSPSSPSSDSDAPDYPTLVGGRVLVVDDEEKNRDLLSRRLKRCEMEVQAVADGKSALHAAKSGTFDLVLLDVMMSGMSGLEALTAFRRDWSSAQLPIIMVTALESSDDVIAALRSGANDYVTKPIDFPVLLARMETQLALKRAGHKIETLARDLSVRNTFIRRAFGRYLSEEIVTSLLEEPEGLELKGEKRVVSILMCDLCGFSSLTEALDASEVVWLLNNYLGTMADIVQSHGGTVDEFIGDAVLAFFGAPVSASDDAERAVACAVEMQQAMVRVNAANRGRGLPEVEMGVAIATGEVIVGNIGSEKRSKYGAVGSTINLAARIEAETRGREIWLSQGTLDAVGGAAAIEREREFHPKGFDKAQRIYQLAVPAESD